MSDFERLITEQCAAYTAELESLGVQAKFKCHFYRQGEKQSVYITYNDGKPYQVWSSSGMDLAYGYYALRAFWSGMNLQRDYAPLPERQ